MVCMCYMCIHVSETHRERERNPLEVGGNKWWKCHWSSNSSGIILLIVDWFFFFPFVKWPPFTEMKKKKNGMGKGVGEIERIYEL